MDYREGFLEGENQLRELMGDDEAETFEKIIRVIHVPSATNGKKAYAILNGELGEAIVFLK